MNITKLVLRRPVSTALVVLAIVVFGVFSIFNFDMELIPDIDMPMMLVYTVYPGASPESVEQLITKEVEDAGEALSGVQSCLSYSYENYSMVAFTYDYDTDMNEGYTNLSAALDMLNLPDDARDPVIMQMDVNAMDTITISASNDGSSDMMAYINDVVVPKLESIPNVAKVSVDGGKENYIRVSLNQEKMNQYGLTMTMIAGYVGAGEYNIPAGKISAGSQNISVSTSSKFLNLDDIKNITLTTQTGAIIRLGDVADITFASQEATAISKYNGETAVTIGVVKNQNAATVNVANKVKKEIQKLQDTDPGVKFQVSYDAGKAILDSLKSIGETLILGVVLAMLVLLLFFGDIKASLIVGSSIPLSLLATLVCMNLFGFDMNIVTMGALVIAIGMIVDNSIVVIESCYRMIEEGYEYKEAAIKGTGIVMMSIVASTITTIVVYLPMSLIKGMAGQMFGQLGFIIVFAMLASLVSALCIVPLLFAKMLPTEKNGGIVNRFLDWIKRGYERILRKLMRRKLLTIAFSVLLLVASFVLASTLQFELIPATYDGSITITSTFRSGTKLSKMDQQFAEIEQMIAEDDNFESYNLTISQNQATLSAYAVADCPRSSQKAVEIYQTKLSNMTGMDILVQPSGGGSEGMSNYSSDLVQVVLESSDLDALTDGAEMVEEMMMDVPGVIKISSDASASQTGAHVVVDPLKAAAAGFSPAQVAGELYATLTGSTVASMESDGKEYDIILKYPEGTFEDVNQLLEKKMVSQMGKSITLGDIAHIEYDEQLQRIQRSNGFYQQTISATCTSDAKSDASKEITQRAAKMNYPSGVQVSSSMRDDIMDENLSAIFQSILAGIFLVFLVMAMQFESPRFSLMVMVCIPFSLIGSFLCLFLARSSMNMVSMMGFLMLMGIVVNNGILLVDTANQESEFMSVPDALVTAGKTRLRPILMTTLTTILAMVPMAFFSDNKMMQGMAFVIIGGLIASTLLCLLMMPTFYLLLSKKDKKKKKKRRFGRKRKKLPEKKKALPDQSKTMSVKEKLLVDKKYK